MYECYLVFGFFVVYKGYSVVCMVKVQVIFVIVIVRVVFYDVDLYGCLSYDVVFQVFDLFKNGDELGFICEDMFIEMVYDVDNWILIQN